MRRHPGRRPGIGLLFAAAVVASVAGAPAAQAATDATVTVPGQGEVVRDRVTLTVRADGDVPDKIDIRLSQDGSSQASGTASIPLPCIDGCDEPGTSTWGNRTFDPVSGAPFSPSGQCNGQWWIQPRVDGGAWSQGSQVVFSAPPTAPRGVSVDYVDGAAEVRWTPSSSRDVVQHRVERSTNGGPWFVLDELAASASTYRDATASDGSHRYRITALRPDGFVNGSPVPACSDKGADLEAISGEASLTVSRDGTATSGGEGSGDGSSNGGTTSGGSTSPSGGSDSGSGSTTSGGSTGGSSTSPGSSPSEDPNAPPEQGSGETTSPTRSRTTRPVPPPPAARRQTSQGVDVPTLQGGQFADSYYGEDDGFSETIDYGDAPVVAGQELVGYDENGQPIYQEIRQPGEVVAFGVVTLDAGKVRTLALGLLLVVLALHTRRWISAH